MDRLPALWEARAMLENLTPLKSDCGKRCGHACCQSPAGEERGMLLFPGEAEYYRDREGYRLLDGVIARLLDMGKTILLVEHNMEFVQAVARKVVFLHRGQVLAQGIMEEIRSDKQLTEIYFGY